MMNFVKQHIIVTAAIAAISSVGWADSSSLSGTYTVQGGPFCENYLNGEAGVSFGFFNLGDTVVVDATPMNLRIASGRADGAIDYSVGRFDETGPVSDGTIIFVNEYINGGSTFRTGYEGSSVSNFGKHLYQKVGKDIQVIGHFANGDELICTLVGQ